MYPYNVVFQDAGIVLTVKTHGHTVGKAVQMERQEQIKENHHKEVNHTAILLIRNPYKAIIGKGRLQKKINGKQNDIGHFSVRPPYPKHKRTAYTAFWPKAPPGREKNISKGTASNG